MDAASPFHRGERFVQERLGERDAAEHNGRAVSDRIVPGALAFVGEQRFVAIGSAASDGRPRASVLIGARGFAQAPDRTTVVLDLARVDVDPRQPFVADLSGDRRIGLLFLDPETKRRLRVNGTAARDGQRLIVTVQEAFPNCPRYIRARSLVEGASDARPANASGVVSDAVAQEVLGRADTLFLASVNPEGGLDVSHRGGAPGFVRALTARALLLPDYAGNSMYNTLGNVVLDGRAGLAVLDVEGHRTLVTSGGAEILWDEAPAPGGVKRFLRLAVGEWTALPMPAELRWTEPHESWRTVAK